MTDYDAKLAAMSILLRLPTFVSCGDKEWRVDGVLHREDGPAVEWANGTKFWYLNGRLHREDGPAIECADGGRWWYFNDKLHRDDGPAIERSDGSRSWWVSGLSTNCLQNYTVGK